MNDYSRLSAEELRELLLNDTLLHEYMTEEDYTALLDIEADFDEPSEKVMDFCYDGLSVLPKYSNIGERDFDINELIESNHMSLSPKRRKLKKAVFIIAAVIGAMFITQIVAAALGFDLFGYIFNWNKPEVVEVTNTAEEVNGEVENTEIEYSAVEEIPLEIKNLVPNYMFDSFQFYIAIYTKQSDNETNTLYFFDEDENLLCIHIANTPSMQIEKDDDGYNEEYSFGNTLFTIFTNMGDYQAMWVYNEYVYSFYTPFKEAQDIKDILDNLY